PSIRLRVGRPLLLTLFLYLRARASQRFQATTGQPARQTCLVQRASPSMAWVTSTSRIQITAAFGRWTPAAQLPLLWAAAHAVSRMVFLRAVSAVILLAQASSPQITPAHSTLPARRPTK